jgi:NADH-quinone oxidoreductase subunit A
MLELQYLPLIIMVIFGFGIGLVFMLLSEWLGARRATEGKQTTYESGVEPYHTARERVPVKFYIVAMSFIVFDIEVVFLYPYAVSFRSFDLMAHLCMFLFILILFIGYYWELKKGGFKWD